MAEALATIATHEPFPVKVELSHLDSQSMLSIAMRGPLKPDYLQALLRDTIAPTMLSGSLKVNVIPSTAEAGLDCRLLPGTDADEFLRRMKTLLADKRITIDFIQKPDSGPISPASGEAWDAIQKVVAEDFPKAFVVPWMSTGGTDSRFLREKGVPAYGFVPIILDVRERERVHGVDERLSVENLNRGIKATYDLTTILCAQP
jgi:acetylornithine deacetylase/succinyl-diaminopimelate desuccinylase-like protein